MNEPGVIAVTGLRAFVGRGVVVSRFPCLEAARQFWFSEQYQSEIMPLREGIAEFEVLVLPALPIPDYIGAGVIGVLRGADSAR